MCADTCAQGVTKSKETYRFLLNTLAATYPCIYDAHRKLSSHISNENFVLFSCFMLSLAPAVGFCIGILFFLKKAQNRDSF